MSQRLLRFLTPVAFGAAIVLMLRGRQLEALGVAIAVFVLSLLPERRPRRPVVEEPAPAEEEG